MNNADTYLTQVLACCLLGIAFSGGEVQADESTTDSTNSEPPPVHPMHRLISSVLDTVPSQTNSSLVQQFSPGNITDTAPFLPSGAIPSYRAYQPHQETNNHLLNSSKDFSPSYFIGEVIPEPYLPETYQNSRSGNKVGNSSHRYFQRLVSSQTALNFQKIFPHIKHGAFHPPGRTPSEEDLSYFQDHVRPVHEPSAEDDGTTTPKYKVNFEDHDQHLDRPIHLPYSFHRGYSNPTSTNPITFESQKSQQPRDSQEYIHHHYSGSAGNNYGDTDTFNNGHSDSYKANKEESLSQTDHSIKHDGSYYGAMDSHDHHHHDPDFVIPSPFHPPEHEPPSHHKDVHYKVHQKKAKSPLHGLLHLAAALLPLGLFVAALQPSIIHVNSSQPMMNKQRSLDTLGLPGLEALERLGLGRLGQADCERRAFCELAVLGGKPEGNTPQLALWKLTNSIPDVYAEAMGFSEMFKAVKSNTCATLKCENSTQIAVSTT